MNQDHLFVTLAMSDGEISAIAVVRTDYKSNVLASFCEAVSSDSDFDDIRFRRVIDGLCKVVLDSRFDKSYIVVAHFAEQVRKELKTAWGRVRTNGDGNRTEVFMGRRWIDTAEMAWPLVYNDMVSGIDLETLCKHFRCLNVDAGTATGDCEALVRVYWAMMNRYKWALTGEETVRSLGGNTLEKVMSIFK